MNIYIFTGGGKKEGFGHITRCISIYQAFIKKGQDAYIFTNSDQSVKKILDGTKYKIINWIDKFNKISSSLNPSGIILIDSYKAPYAIYKRASENFKLAIFLDDYKRLNYPRGVVINSAINAEELNYPHHRGIKYLTGIKYAPLRKIFWADNKRVVRKNISSILLTFGASVDKEFLFNILKKLNQHYPEVSKKVIIGINSINIGDIKQFRKDKISFLFSPSLSRIRTEMIKSDLAIAGGGQTLNELAKTGLPTISICLDKNQVDNINGWLKKGFIKYAGTWNNKNTLPKILKIIQEMKDANLRKKMSGIGQSCIDGLGSVRIAEKTLKWLN